MKANVPRKETIYSKVCRFHHTNVQKGLHKTVLTFLPPLIRPNEEYSTVCETIHRSVKLAKFWNLKHTHITVDIGVVELQSSLEQLN